MRCIHCGHEGSVGTHVRFCAGCGRSLVGAADRQVPGTTVCTAADQEAKVIAFECIRCGQTLPPDQFFDRGMNVAKLVALAPLNLFLPFVYFLFRRERMICGGCQTILPEAARARLLPAFQAPHHHRALQGFVQKELMPMPASPRALRLRQKAKGFHLGGIVTGALAGIAGMIGALGASLWAIVADPGLFALLPFAPGAFLGTGALMFLSKRRRLQTRAVSEEEGHLRLRLMALARNTGGRLTVRDVAEKLGVDSVRAEVLLDSLVNHETVTLELDEEAGTTWYRFDSV